METTKTTSQQETDYAKNGLRFYVSKTVNGEQIVRFHRVIFTSATTARTIATGSTWTQESAGVWTRDNDGLRAIVKPGASALYRA